MGTTTEVAGGLQIRRSRDQWRELLERFEQSSQSREEFCREQGVTVGHFNRQRRALSKAVSRSAVKAAKPLFLEVASQAGPEVEAWDIELELGAGVILRLRRPC
jgi:hypothetical protein